MGLFDPLTRFDRGGEASGLPENLLQSVQHVWRKQQGFASRDVDIHQRFQATRLVEDESVADGIAVDPQQLGHLSASLGLTAGE